MKTPFRELGLYRGLVASRRLHEGSAKQPWWSRSIHKKYGCGATELWSVHEAFMEPPWLLVAPPWSLCGAFAKPSRSFDAHLLAPPAICQIMTGPAFMGWNPDQSEIIFGPNLIHYSKFHWIFSAAHFMACGNNIRSFFYRRN